LFIDLTLQVKNPELPVDDMSWKPLIGIAL